MATIYITLILSGSHYNSIVTPQLGSVKKRGSPGSRSGGIFSLHALIKFTFYQQQGQRFLQSIAKLMPENSHKQGRADFPADRMISSDRTCSVVDDGENGSKAIVKDL